MRILLIEDEKEIANSIKKGLKDRYIVDVVYNGEEGEYSAQVNEYDLIILDITLPDIDGVTVCKKIRAAGIKTPIIMLTAKSEVESKVEALDAGADDYLTKPFNLSELLARLRALMRRNSSFVPNIITLGELKMDTVSKTVSFKGANIFLRRKEFELLEYLIRNKKQVVTRDMILEHVWGNGFDMMTNTVDVHIKYLRDRVEKPFGLKLIKTIHGLGYKIE